MSDQTMRYRDSEGDLWSEVPGSHGDEFVDEGGTIRSYGHVLSQYGPLTLVHDDEDTPVYESPEELAQEIARLRRENTALQQLVTRAEQDIATLTRDRDQALEEPTPAPRDTDLTQQVRALVKRYGAPVIAAEAARQAKHH